MSYTLLYLYAMLLHLYAKNLIFIQKWTSLSLSENFLGEF